MVSFEELPEDCVSNIISRTSPPDACRTSSVSRRLKFLIDSDVIWEQFLPSDHLDILSEVPLIVFSTKKELFCHLVESYVLVNDGKMSFSVGKTGGKKCYMLGARQLSIESADNPQIWKWKSSARSRFGEVAKLNTSFRNIHIRGRFQTRLLSQETTYVAYIVVNNLQATNDSVTSATTYVNTMYKKANKDSAPLIRFCGPGHRKICMMHPCRRRDGWMEIEAGLFFNDLGEDGEIETRFSTMELRHGLIVEGIEFRPKSGDIQ